MLCCMYEAWFTLYAPYLFIMYMVLLLIDSKYYSVYSSIEENARARAGVYLCFCSDHTYIYIHASHHTEHRADTQRAIGNKTAKSLMTKWWHIFIVYMYDHHARRLVPRGRERHQQRVAAVPFAVVLPLLYCCVVWYVCMIYSCIPAPAGSERKGAAGSEWGVWQRESGDEKLKIKNFTRTTKLFIAVLNRLGLRKYCPAVCLGFAAVLPAGGAQHVLGAVLFSEFVSSSVLYSSSSSSLLLSTGW